MSNDAKSATTGLKTTILTGECAAAFVRQIAEEPTPEVRARVQEAVRRGGELLREMRGHTPELVARAWDPIGWDWYDRNKDSENAATQETRQIFLADQTKRATAVLEALQLT